MRFSSELIAATFALLLATTAQAQPSYSVSASASPGNLQPGQTVLISGTVTASANVSGEEMSLSITLNGTTVGNMTYKNLKLTAKKPLTESYNWYPSKNGNYTVIASVMDSKGRVQKQATSAFTVTSVTAVNGVCGPSNGGSFASTPTVGLCSKGTASAVSGSGPWSWSCLGSNGGSTAQCSASLAQIVNGMCGVVAGTCESGSAQNVTNASGNVTWMCTGSNNGISASCVTVFADWATYQGAQPHGWWAIQNPWNNGSLVNGKDYTQTVTLDTSTFPNSAVISWTWPSTANSDNVWGYPEVVYGSQAGIWQSPDGQGPTPVQIKNLTALTGSYNMSISGNTDQFDVLWETHLTSAPNSGQLFEFGIFPHSPSYLTAWINSLSVPKYNYNAGGISATIVITSNGSQPYIIVLPTQGDMLVATVDLKAILDFLITKGVLTGDEYIEGFEMGTEPQSNSGALTINGISYNWNGLVVP